LSSRTLFICAALILSGCTPDEEPVHPAGLALEIDGLQITVDELKRYDDYFRALDPTMGRMYRTSELLDQFVLPMRLAQRAFPEERAKARVEAAALAKLVGNGGYQELVRLGEVLGGYKPDKPFSRNQLPLALTRYAFDEENVFKASPPIEVPQGFCLIASYRLHQGVTTVEDLVDAYQVPFYTHTNSVFATWYETEKHRIRNRVTYVHPDYRGALPAWVEME
jgi:hypothetical protein